MFNTVFIEKNLVNDAYTQSILKKIKYQDVKVLKNYNDVWGKVKKPYLQKRETLNLFIAQKKGDLIKEAPQAYGLNGEKHYYYIHAYNCIYECQYCYLQGYFNTPDLVLFTNHSEIIREMQSVVNSNIEAAVWFHAGEFSDSLALSHFTNELEIYFDFFYQNKNAKLELRTKAVNIKPLLKLKPAPNIFVSFTMSSTEGAKGFDYKCPNIKHRLKAIKTLVDHGYMIGLHLDPIIYHHEFEVGYQELLSQLSLILPCEQLGYISIGVVRFTKDVYREVTHNYPESTMLKQNFVKSFDNKIRYHRPMRKWIMNKVKNICLSNGFEDKKIYFCMED